MKKRNMILAAVGAFVLLAGVYLVPRGISAYFTDAERAENLITVGVNTIIPPEDFDPPVPGEKTVKSPKAQNTGNVPCFVRGRFAASDSRAAEYLTYYYQDAEGANSEDWTLDGDGWWYLNGYLEPEAVSAPLFDAIALAEDIPEDLKGFTIDVVFESVQTAGAGDPVEAFRLMETE